ncbi:hypothetical protein HYR54_04065 [Candidatus Acetothermia bacterium]|nr:hypothetical protein [Candidatus Acetothermia bacterium]MBI3357748.1 hypothetical protein [Nitrospirota bacterium]
MSEGTIRPAQVRGGCILVVVMAGLIMSSCSSRENQVKHREGPPAKREDYPKLAGQLFELATAQKPGEYAKDFDLTYKDGLVQIVLEARGTEWVQDLEWAVEAVAGQVEMKVENLVQARVPIEALLKLARHPRVIYIRPPVKPKR